MVKSHSHKALLTGAVFAVASTVAHAQTDFAQDFAAELYEGHTAEAVVLAEAQLAVRSDNQQVAFALGSAQFLKAVENLGQGLYRYGLRSDLDASFYGISGLPFLRLPVPENPQPDQVTYDGLRNVLNRFVDDLAVAEATLADIGPEEFDLPLDLARIRLDFDGDGKGSEQEGLLYSFAAVSRITANTGFLFDFDQSDAPWLHGYCHLLSAMAHFPLAHDWETAFNETFHSLFPKSDLPSSYLERELINVRAALEVLIDQYGEPPRRPPRLKLPPGWPKRGEYKSHSEWQKKIGEWEESDAGQLYLPSEKYKAYEQALARWEEYILLKSYLSYGSIADLIVFIHLFNWPVVEPERMAAVRVHLLRMVELSRENWRRIQAETDNKNEWIPSPKQTVIFRMRVDDNTVAAWHAFLDEFEAILEGRRLIKHWRYASKGVNLRRMFEEPRTFDPVLIAQGSAVIPYLEEGDLVTRGTAETMFDLFKGGFFAYFIWFN